MSTVREQLAYERAAEVGRLAGLRRRARPVYTLVIDRDPVPGSPFWHWRVLRDGTVVADGWRLSWKAAHVRANAEIVERHRPARTAPPPRPARAGQPASPRRALD